ncbi:MAG: hypothetical protein ABI400_06400 [Lacisediminihabitans sp.]
MVNPVEQALVDRLVFTRDLRTAGARASFFARARSGELVAVIRGVYMAAEEWSELDRHGRYRAKVMAVAALCSEPLVFSHHSAAALWRLPSVEAWPAQAHAAVPLAAGGRSNGTLIRHTVGVPTEVVRIDGVRATSLVRTVVDLARIGSFAHAVVVADAALHRTAHPLQGLPRTTLSRADLDRELAGVPLRHGTAKSREVIEFADGAADRPGESMSRVSIRSAGVTMPQLQVSMRGASGRRYFVDFWWPSFNVIGEFDGFDKYSNPEFLRGRSPERAVYEEKLREDDPERPVMA